MPSPNEIKKGTVINIKGDLWIVVGFQRVSPGKGSSFLRTKMKNMTNGKVKEENLKSSEQLTFEEVTHKNMQYLYNDSHLYTFMDTVTYEQVPIAAEDIETEIPYLKEGLGVKVMMHDGKAKAVVLPMKIQYSVTYTEPAVKGDTASGNVYKEAELDNGLKVKVPAFINQGDEITINTDTGEYSERISK